MKRRRENQHSHAANSGGESTLEIRRCELQNHRIRQQPFVQTLCASLQPNDVHPPVCENLETVIQESCANIPEHVSIFVGDVYPPVCDGPETAADKLCASYVWIYLDCWLVDSGACLASQWGLNQTEWGEHSETTVHQLCDTVRETDTTGPACDENIETLAHALCIIVRQVDIYPRVCDEMESSLQGDDIAMAVARMID